MGRERPDQGAVAAKVSCERGKTLTCVCVCVLVYVTQWMRRTSTLYVCLYSFTHNCCIYFVVCFCEESSSIEENLCD